jgi:ParB family chromosome partitioning protein
MTSKMEKELHAALGPRRSREEKRNDVATTLLGQAGRESVAPVLLKLTQLVRSPFQSRGKRDEDYMENLVESIRTEGLLDPIIVRPLPAPADAEGGHTMSSSPPMYELVAGHHRADAFGILSRPEIPAFIRHLTDAEAARALTSENTTRKGLGDWELYKHMKMLYSVGAVDSQRNVARVLNISRAAVQSLESFALLPQASGELLDDHPDLVGYNLAGKLKLYLPEHQLHVFDALVLLSKGKLTQASVPAWIEAKVNPQLKKQRKEFTLAGGARLIVTPDGARLSGNLNYERLQKLIEENIHTLTLNE